MMNSGISQLARRISLRQLQVFEAVARFTQLHAGSRGAVPVTTHRLDADQET